MYQDSRTSSGSGGYRPQSLMGPTAPTISSAGQYSSAPRSIPTASQGPIQRVGRPSAPAKRPAPKKKAAPKVSIPSLSKFLAGDTTFNQQKSDLMKQMEQFKTSNASQQAMTKQDFNTALKKMLDQKTNDLGSIQNDFAARGLLNSGLYTDAVGKYDTGYQTQYNDLVTGQQRSLSDLLESLGNYQTENKSTLTAAQQDAIRRRAQKYGITS